MLACACMRACAVAIIGTLWWLVFVNLSNWSHLGKGKLGEEISAYGHVCRAIS